MSDIITRNPCINEIPELRSIWKRVFGSVGEEAFFIHYYEPKLCVIAEHDNDPASVGYLVPFGHILNGQESVPCAMIYSVATLPEYRCMGHGTAVVNELIRLARKLGYPAVVLCPIDEKLFGYYGKHANMYDWFYVNEQVFSSALVSSDSVMLTEVTINEYNNQREELLKGITHIKHDFYTLEYQSMLCDELGGGLFRIGDSCAVVESQQDGAVWIKELLLPGGGSDDFTSDPHSIGALTAIANKFPSSKYVVRTPSRIGMGRRFGMIALPDDLQADLSDSTTSPWYGMAFD